METPIEVKKILSRQAILTLMVLSFAQFVIALDYSIVYVALPEITRNLTLSNAHAQWVVSAYALFFAGSLLLGGRLCDRYGAGHIFLIATSIFGLASLLGGLAPNGELLMLSRALQGISAAAMQPAIISLISSRFAEGNERARALSIWGAVGASGLVVGVVLGGLFTVLSWRLVFYVNVPLVIICVLAGFSSMRQKNDTFRKQARIPLLASLIGTAAVLSLVLLLTLVTEQQQYQEIIPLLSLIVAVLIVTFLLTERISPRPLIERDVRPIRTLRIGCAASAFYMAGVGSEFFLVTLLLQDAYEKNALTTGMMFLPLSITIILGNMLAGRLIGRFRANKVLFSGFIIGGLGIALIAVTLDSTLNQPYLYAGLIISGLGHGLIYTSKFVVGIRGIPEDKQGAASSLMVTAQYGSGAISLALLVIILSLNQAMTAYKFSFALLVLFCLIGAGIALLDRKEINHAQ